MLVLSRKLGEKINIGADVVVEMLEINGRQVRLGVQAPRDVPVHRQEIWLNIQREQANGEKAS